MQRRGLLKMLGTYRDLWVKGDAPRHATFDQVEEEGVLAQFAAFVEATPDCFERTSPVGHVTGSALVVSHDLRQVLLTLHGKLGLWLQLGGHADGCPHPHEVAYREVEEESGLRQVAFLKYEAALSHHGAQGQGGESATRPWSAPPLPFDVDAHLIPGRPGEPAHRHYDVRYLVAADPAEPLVISNESKDLRWFSLDDARRVTDERSMHRQFDKLAFLAERLTTVPRTLA